MILRQTMIVVMMTIVRALNLAAKASLIQWSLLRTKSTAWTQQHTFCWRGWTILSNGCGTKLKLRLCLISWIPSLVSCYPIVDRSYNHLRKIWLSASIRLTNKAILACLRPCVKRTPVRLCWWSIRRCWTSLLKKTKVTSQHCTWLLP